ncbi:hypothetical protein [Aurantiacibacter gangjinensis]|uniref:Lipoprotein n=1 Tax=Aurantiacibacter gangjinensis TaxID=502682 RepID=A0A0G9MVI9_9SPHN|nr:hypothetical protein [Aurantiacibacter gangjinensis]KLE33298.1 hypothetical protein AAW01_04945 [Aurantiacibacter gangjinensis]
MRKLFSVCVVMIAISGCATVENNYVPEVRQVSFPQLGAQLTRSLGEEMVKQGTETTTRGVWLPEPNPIGAFELSSGFYRMTGAEGEYIFTSFERNSPDPEVGTLSMGGGIFDAGAGSWPEGIRFSTEEQQTCVIARGAYGIGESICDTEYPYMFTERGFLTSNDFQQTLIYSGRVGDRIRVSYREFSGSLARPAFSNDAEYDLSESDIIAYRGARLRVIEANNESITYEVISNFNVTP